MRLLMILLLPILSALPTGAAIVNNSTAGATSEDSLCVAFYALDSLGCASSADSVMISVCGPFGSIVYRDSLAITDSRIVPATIGGSTVYYFVDQVANLDGIGADGVYSISLIAVNSTLSLTTPNGASFQVVGSELSDQLSAIGDSAEVAGWVWNTPQGGHTEAGTFGRYLDAQISGLSSGSGAYSVGVVALDTTNSLTIPGINIAVRNLGQTSLIAVDATDNDGLAAFNLEADTYLLSATAAGYAFEAFDTLVVAGETIDTIRGSCFDPGAPVLGNFCRVWGCLFDASGNPDGGVSVSAWLPEGATTYSNGIIVPNPVTTVTDSSGCFYLDLLPSDSLGAPEESHAYEFTVSRPDGTILRQRLTVPDSTSWRLSW